MLVDSHAASGQRGSPAAFLDLQHARADLHGVVLVDGALMLQREDEIEVLSPYREKGVARLCGGYRKALVEFGNELLP